MATADNDRFLRWWFEVDEAKILRAPAPNQAQSASSAKWYPYIKGGEFKKWHGNVGLVVNWADDGKEIRENIDEITGRIRSHNYNGEYSLRSGLTWTSMSSRGMSARFVSEGFLFDAKGPMGFGDKNIINYSIALMNSSVGKFFLSSLSSTKDFKIGHILSLPYRDDLNSEAIEFCVGELSALASQDDCSCESSWSFSKPSLLDEQCKSANLSCSIALNENFWDDVVARTIRHEAQINEIFVNAFGLAGTASIDPTISDVTLRNNATFRHGSELTDEERKARLKSDMMRELVSYAVGCMMGRYSLAETGLIYAHADGVGFDPARYGPFPADDDGIIPLTEEKWFSDDAAVRIEEFLGIAWPDAPVMETLTTLMDGLSMGNAGEPRAALRSYLSKQFYKDHLQTYKNRPIYWLFSSGKHRAFEALVYLHRYNEGTLARMRTNHVTPLMGKLQQRISDLDAEIATSSSSAEKTRKSRDKEKIAKQLIELRAFDEELRHLADQRIALDLDDGVKANYARFGNLLAFKDKVCPKKKGEDE